MPCVSPNNSTADVITISQIPVKGNRLSLLLIMTLYGGGKSGERGMEPGMSHEDVLKEHLWGLAAQHQYGELIFEVP